MTSVGPSRQVVSALAQCELNGAARVLSDGDESIVNRALAETLVLRLPGSARRKVTRVAATSEFVLWRTAARGCTAVAGDVLTAGTACAGTLSFLTAFELLHGTVMWELGGPLRLVEIGS